MQKWYNYQIKRKRSTEGETFPVPGGEISARISCRRAKGGPPVKLRIVSLLCVLAMTVSLMAGCSSGDSSAAQTTSESTPTAEQTPEPEPEPTPEPTPEAEQAEIQLGTWDGQTYSNSWTGITFTLPDTWTPLTAEQILQIVGAGSDYAADSLNMDPDALSAQTSEVDTYDFYAMRADGTAGFFCDVVNPAAAGTPSMTAEEYVQQVSAMMQVMDGLTVTAEDPVETTLGPLSGVQLNMTTVAEEVDLTTAMSYFVSEKDGYLLVYFLSANSQEGLNEVIDLIEQIDGTQA